MAFVYSVCQLSMEMPFPCPGLVHSTEAPDIRVRESEVPTIFPRGDSAYLRVQVGPSAAIVAVDNVARFLVRDGSDISFQRCSTSEESGLRFFTLGMMLEICLAQRGHLVIRAAAFRYGTSGVMVAGPPGIGKSAVLAAFLHRGCRFLADEFCVISSSDRAEILPGPPLLHQWGKSIRAVGEDSSKFSRVRPGIDKWQRAVGADTCCNAQAPRRLYVLEPWDRDEVAIDEASGHSKLRLLLQQSCQAEHLRPMGLQSTTFDLAGRVAARIDVRRARFAGRLSCLDRVADRLAEDLSDLEPHVAPTTSTTPDDRCAPSSSPGACS